MKMNSIQALILGMALALPSSGCGGGNSLQSGWVDHDVTVDGDLQEWQGHLTLFEDAEVDLGVLNDEEYLYVSIVTASRDVQRQIQMRGLIVWLDPTGDKEKTFGIRYPLGLQTADLGNLDMQGMRERGEPSAEERQRAQELFEETLDELEILHSEDHRRRLHTAEATGIEVRVRPSAASLTYELRIPLEPQEGSEYFVRAEPGQKVSIGIATPEVDREAMMAQFGGRGGPGREGGRPGGGGGRMGGGRGRGGGRGMGGGPPSPPESIDAWATVQLASFGG
jgi:hypothetical protein